MNYVVLDGIGGNLWEKAVAEILETLPSVAAYVKNDRLGFTIPYTMQGRSHEYIPTSSSGSSPAMTRPCADADRRGLRDAEDPKRHRREGQHRQKACGCPRSTPMAASAGGGTRN